jgi:hypothetical protein
LAVVHLQNSVRHGQANAAPLLRGREVEVEDAGANLVGDAFPVVADPDIRPPGIFRDADFEDAAGRHSLGAVDDDIQQGLFQKVGIDAAEDGPRGRLAFYRDATRLELGRSQHQHTGHHAAQVLILKLELDGTGKVDEGLDHAVEAANFALDDVEMAESVTAGMDFVAKQFEVHDDGIDRVLHS